jgi:peroxiredoxin
MKNTLIPFAALALTLSAMAATPPSAGDKAPDFSLSTPEGKMIRLAQVAAKTPVVLVVLRGFPGYQCPYCNRQVQELLGNAHAFAEAGVHVVLVYPGPPDAVGSKAKEFLSDKKLPANFDLVLDPGYGFTNLYRLRWDAPGETAYPSTFLIDRQGIIFFSKVVKEHAGRTTAAEILEALPKSEP